MIHFAYRVASHGRSALAGLLLAAASAALACSAGVKPTGTGTGGAGGSGPGGAQAAGGSAGTRPPLGGIGGIVINPDAGSACQQVDYTFEPKIPTVILLVDRSGSMFDCISSSSDVEFSCPTFTDTAWVKLRDGILPVVQQLEKDVRFGFATVTGSNPQYGGTCPVLNQVAPKLMNYGDISTLYSGLGPGPNTNDRGVKFETPVRQVLETIGGQLAADTTPGDKYILFVTDGEPDYCGDGNALCPPDGVMWQLQRLKQMNITTLVFGIKATIAQTLPMGVLEAFANAGAGEPAKVPVRMDAPDVYAIFDQCFNKGANEPHESVFEWTKDFLSIPANAICSNDAERNNCRGRSLGVYSATAGPTRPYQPDVTNQQALITQLSNALAGVKSCVFDLSNIGGRSIKVDRARLDQASVKIEGTTVPLDASSTNGWNMVSDTQLQLFGPACDAWRDPNAKNIAFNFPCDIIIVL